MANSNSAETMTLQDFVEAAALYPRSKEYFQLVKECSEMELMAMCLENSEFVTESCDLTADLIDELAVLTESTDLYEESVKEKIGNGAKFVWGKIVSGFSAIANAIVAAWNHLVSFVTGRHRTYGKDKLEALPAPQAFSAASALAKVKGMDDTAKAGLYKALYDYISSPEKNGNSIVNGSGGWKAPTSPATVRQTNSMIKILYDAAKKADPNVSPINDANRSVLALYLENISDSAKNAISIPKFTFDVFDMIPKLAKIMENLNIDGGKQPSKKRLTAAINAINELDRQLNKVWNHTDAPTADKLPRVNVKLTKSEIEDKHKELVEAQKTYKAMNTAINFDPGEEGNYATAVAAFSDTLRKFNVRFKVFSGVAINALADTMANLSSMGKRNKELEQLINSWMSGTSNLVGKNGKYRSGKVAKKGKDEDDEE